ERTEHVAGTGAGVHHRFVRERVERARASMLHGVGRADTGTAAVSGHVLLDDMVRTIQLARQMERAKSRNAGRERKAARPLIRDCMGAGVDALACVAAAGARRMAASRSKPSGKRTVAFRRRIVPPV